MYNKFAIISNMTNVFFLILNLFEFDGYTGSFILNIVNMSSELQEYISQKFKIPVKFRSQILRLIRDQECPVAL